MMIPTVDIGHEVVDRPHDLVAARYRERAAGAEIDLHVDDDQGPHEISPVAAR